MIFIKRSPGLLDKPGLFIIGYEEKSKRIEINRPGSDLLSRDLSQSTIGASGFHGRVRYGIGCGSAAVTTGSINLNPSSLNKELSKRYTQDLYLRNDK